MHVSAYIHTYLHSHSHEFTTLYVMPVPFVQITASFASHPICGSSCVAYHTIHSMGQRMRVFELQHLLFSCLSSLECIVIFDLAQPCIDYAGCIFYCGASSV